MIGMLPGLAARVHQVHGANHSELERVEILVREMADELFPHMLKEEQVLFPYINSVEVAAKSGKEPAIPFFGTAKNPIRMMMLDHEAVGEQLV
jgi:regulator of cell morphogenesis and NO signaling